MMDRCRTRCRMESTRYGIDAFGATERKRLLFRNDGFSLGYPGNSIRDSSWDAMFNSFDHCVLLDSVLALGCN